MIQQKGTQIQTHQITMDSLNEQINTVKAFTTNGTQHKLLITAEVDAKIDHVLSLCLSYSGTGRLRAM